MEIEYTDLILASSEAGGYPLQWSPQGPAWKKTWSPRSPCGEVPAGKKSPLSHSCGAKKRPGESMIWHKFHIRGSWEFVIQFREPSNVEQKIMRKKKKNICSRHPIKASSQSIKGNPRPMSKVPVLTLEFHDLFWSQRKDISEMLSFMFIQTDPQNVDSYRWVWVMSCGLRNMYVYIYIYMIIYVYKAKSLNFTWYGWSHEEKQSTRQRVFFSAERPSTVCIWLRALNCTFAIIDRLDIQSSMCANYTIC